MTPQQIERLGERLLRKHGLSCWRFWVSSVASNEFNGKSCFGSKTITLPAQMVVRSRYAICQVILHEIAHVLAGLKAGHGPRWQRIARELGVRERNIRESLDYYRAEWANIGVWPWEGVLAYSARSQATARRGFKNRAATE